MERRRYRRSDLGPLLVLEMGLRSIVLSRVGLLASSGSQKRYLLTSYIEQVDTYPPYIFLVRGRPVVTSVSVKI